VTAIDRLVPPGGRLSRTRVTVAAGPMIGPVLARVIGIHASRAGLPVDRVGDALLLADALASRAPDFVEDGRVPVSVQSESGRLEIRVGPLRADSSRRLLDGAAIPGAGRIVERLADEVRVRSGAAGGETLILRLVA
jgi:hypothetical protein